MCRVYHSSSLNPLAPPRTTQAFCLLAPRGTVGVGAIGTVGGIVALVVGANEALNSKFAASEARLEERLGARIDGLARELKGVALELRDQGARMQAKFDQEDAKFFQLLLKQSTGPPGDSSEGGGPSS